MGEAVAPLNIISSELEPDTLAYTLEISRTGVWDWDLVTDEILWSRQAEKVFGLMPGQFNGTRHEYISRVYQEDWPRIYALSQGDGVHPNGDFSIEYRVCWPNGEIHWVLAQGRMTFSCDGDRCPMRMTGTVTLYDDIRNAEAENREIISILPQLTYTADATGKIEYVNPQWLEFTGLTFKESTDPLQWHKCIHPDDYPNVMSAWDSAIKEGRSSECEFRCKARNSNNDYRWFLSRSQPTRNAKGQIVRWIGTCVEIQQQKKTQERIALLATLSKRLSELSRTWQEQLVEIMGLTLPELGDVCAIDLVLPDGHEGRVSRIGEICNSGTQKCIPESASPEFNEYIKTALVAPLVVKDRCLGSVVWGLNDGSRKFSQDDRTLAEDVAARIAFEVDRQYLLSKLREAVSLRDEFVSIAAHELRTPLASLAMQLRVLNKAFVEGKPVLPQEQVGRIMASAKNQVQMLSGLVADLLDVTRITHGKLSLQRETMDLGLLLNRVLEETEVEISRKAFRPGDVVGEWDPRRLEQVFVNLISNAIKYGEGRPIGVALENKGKVARFSIQDHGRGISIADQERIFQRFERATGQWGPTGLGLGLYIVRQIIEAHGGKIWVESELGQGAQFIFEIPVSNQKSKG